MPTGVITDALAVAAGALLGAAAGRALSTDFKDKMNMIFGCCSMGMGIASIVLMQNMPAVIFALIIGTALGLVLRLGERIQSAASALLGKTDDRTALLVTAIVLFCASGTGIYGSIVSGMTGDHSILISKAILDLFTAMIFACTIGAVTAAIAIPQFLVFMLLYMGAGLILPMTDASMTADFKACGGFIMLATGFRMLKLTMFPIADMIPALVLVMPLSHLWSAWILPLVS